MRKSSHDQAQRGRKRDPIVVAASLGAVRKVKPNGVVAIGPTVCLSTPERESETRQERR